MKKYREHHTYTVLSRPTDLRRVDCKRALTVDWLAAVLLPCFERSLFPKPLYLGVVNVSLSSKCVQMHLILMLPVAGTALYSIHHFSCNHRYTIKYLFSASDLASNKILIVNLTTNPILKESMTFSL